MPYTGTYDEIKTALIKQAQDGWPGPTGEKRGEELQQFIEDLTDEYSKAFEMTKEEVLISMESQRVCSSTNHYQRARFPSLDKVIVFEKNEDFLKKFPSKKFRCPSCEGISTNPDVCNSGLELSPGETCDWKAYGLFGTLGKGVLVASKEGFRSGKGIVYEMFKPIELEEAVQQ